MPTRLRSGRTNPTCYCPQTFSGEPRPDESSAWIDFRRRGARAFTLVEIMIVVVIIGLLAAMAIPAMKRVIRRSENSQVANDLRVFAEAFERYSMTNGKWPASAGNGVVPVGMRVGMIKNGVWQAAKTPIGGQWRWTYNSSGTPFTAGISIVGFTCPVSQLLEIDKAIDDGDLTTGNFQRSGGRVTILLEP